MAQVRLSEEWECNGKTYGKDFVLDLDEDRATSLVENGTATYEKATEDVKVIGTPETNTSGDNTSGAVTLTKAQFDELIEKAASAKQGIDLAGKRPHIGVVKDAVDDDPQRGFRDFGDFLFDVANEGKGGGMTKRLAVCKSMTKTVGSDEYAQVEDSIGGFLVPPKFREEILEKPMEGEYVRANGAMQLPIEGQLLSINAITDTDRTSTLFGGIQVYFIHERKQMTASKGEFEQIELKPKTLTGLTYVTDVLLNNKPALGPLIGSLFGKAFMFKETNKFLKGSGAGEPLGVLNADSTYSLAKETDQPAATIETANILKMRAHMFTEAYPRAVWLASASCMEQLNSLTMKVGVAGAPIALVNIGNDGIERMMGKPLIYTEHCEAIGTVGDIILASWPEYLIGETLYTRSDSSIHIRFDYNETAFRFVKQIDGQPWWRSTLTLNNSWEVSPFVTLATRA